MRSARFTAPLERARTGYENYRRALAPGFHHGRYCIGKTFGPYQTNCGFARQARMAVGEVPGHLFVRAVDYLHAQLHKAFQCRVAKAASQGENMLNAFILQGQSQQVTASTARNGLGVHKLS